MDDLLAHEDWFIDPARGTCDAVVPPIIVIDDFYDDPEGVRRLALGKRYVQYIPPDPEIVGPDIAARNAHRQGRWLSTAFVTYHGELAGAPFYGERHNP